MYARPYDEVKQFTDFLDKVVALILVALTLSATGSVLTASSLGQIFACIAIAAFLGVVACDLIIGILKP